MAASRRARPWDRLADRFGFVLAAVVAVVLIAGATVLRLPPSGTPPLDRMVPVLIGTALLLFALLALPRLPGLAWAVLALSAAAAALEIVAVSRSLETVAAGAAWRDLALIAGLALIGAIVVGAAFACRGWRRASNLGRIAVTVVGAGVVATGAAVAWAVAAAGVEAAPRDAATLTPIRQAARLGLATMTGGFVVGSARALGPAVMRAAERSRKAPDRRSGGALWRYLAMLADELMPSRADARRKVAETERARLAADLHAHVLPELRRAAAAAESAGLPSDVQVDLRRALEDVEQLMHERQSIVLEQYGLVAALEWLAERTEERSSIRVELDLEGSVPDGPRAVDPRVARAAFRIALLGLDNVVRHADARTAALRLAADTNGLRLTVEDDGASTKTLDAAGGRGIPDMRTAAAESGGSIAFVAGTGTRIEAVWPISFAPQRPGPSPSAVVDRSDSPTR